MLDRRLLGGQLNVPKARMTMTPAAGSTQATAVQAIRPSWIPSLGVALVCTLLGSHCLLADSTPCAFSSIGVDASLATSIAIPVPGRAIGQVFYASDTLIRSITVWRPASDYAGPIRLFLVGTHASFRDGLPEPDDHPLITGPAMVLTYGDGEHRIRCEFTFDPPLVLPRRDLFAWVLRDDHCYSYWELLGTGDVYRPGEAWFFGRTSCEPEWLGFARKEPSVDEAFRIEFVNPEVPSPVSVVGTRTGKCQNQVTWAVAQSNLLEATVFRRTIVTDWLALGSVVVDPAGQFVFDDTLVTPGERYAYRLGLPSCGNDPLFGETWVTAAGGLELKLVGTQPVDGRLRLAWSAAVGRAFNAKVYKRGVQTDGWVPVDSTWRAMGTTGSDGSGQLVFDDARVLGGATYDYRLGVVQCGREVSLGKAYRIEAPCGLGLPVLTGQAGTCEVRLAWSAPDSARHTATLYRRGPDPGWSSLAPVTSDSLGLSSYVDRDVLPGQYAYRLRVTTPYCGEAFSNEVTASLPAVQVVAVTPSVSADHVSLSWSVTGQLHAAATLYRRSLTTEWRALAQLVADDSGEVRYQDAQVSDASSHAYTYRLGIVQCGREYLLGQVWTDVPFAVPLAIRGVRPNPGDTDLNVTFTLPDAAPARFEVMDLAGRRIFAREVGDLGAGEHVLNLSEGRTLPSGVYLIRLIRGGEIRTTRGVIVRQRPGRSLLGH